MQKSTSSTCIVLLHKSTSSTCTVILHKSTLYTCTLILYNIVQTWTESPWTTAAPWQTAGSQELQCQEQHPRESHQHHDKQQAVKSTNVKNSIPVNPISSTSKSSTLLYTPVNTVMGNKRYGHMKRRNRLIYTVCCWSNLIKYCCTLLSLLAKNASEWVRGGKISPTHMLVVKWV